jgi:hypothetical protein
LQKEKYGSEANFTPEFFTLINTQGIRERVDLSNNVRLVKYKVILTEFTLRNVQEDDKDDLISVCIDTPTTPVTSFNRGIVHNVLDQIYVRGNGPFSKSQNVTNMSIREMDFGSTLMGPFCFIFAVNSKGVSLPDIGILGVFAFQEVAT